MDGRTVFLLSHSQAFHHGLLGTAKVWCSYKDFHLAIQCPGPSVEAILVGASLRSLASVGLGGGVLVGLASRPCLYAEALLAPPLGDHLARPTGCCIYPHVLDQDILVAMLSARPVGIDPRHSDPMLDEALADSPRVLPTVNCLVVCTAWGDDVWLTHVVLSMG